MKKILIINILTFLILGILSCSVNPKTKTSQSIENEETKVSSLNEILKKNLEEKEPLAEEITLYELLRIPVFKEEVIKRYSTKFHAMAEEVTERSTPVQYDSVNNYYHCNGLSENGTVNVKYYVDTDELDISMLYHGLEVKHDGTIDCGNWVKGYYQNDFGENDLKSPYIENEFRGVVNDKFDCQLYVIFNANEGFRLKVDGESPFDQSPAKVEILVRDESDGEIYSISTIVYRDFFFIDPEQVHLFGYLLNKGNITIVLKYVTRINDHYNYRFRIYNETKFEAAKTVNLNI